MILKVLIINYNYFPQVQYSSDHNLDILLLILIPAYLFGSFLTIIKDGYLIFENRE